MQNPQNYHSGTVPPTGDVSEYYWDTDGKDPIDDQMLDFMKWLKSRKKRKTKPKRDHAKLKKRRRIANASKRQNRRK